MYKYQNNAFSLVELLITLIIISCILAAFAPVITKRLSNKEYAVAQGIELLSSECSSIDADCTLCFKDKCIICSKNCAKGVNKDIESCSCFSCDTFDSNCASCNVKECETCKDGYYFSDEKKCASCSDIDPFCIKCSDSTTCTECASTHNLIENTCVIKDENCTSYEEGICTSCKTNYYLKDGICTLCTNSTCLTCDSSGKCTSCINNYYVNNGACKSCTDSICLACNASGKCTSCINNYYVNNGTCTQCTNSICSSCDTTGKCTSCIAGYYNNNGTCTNCNTLDSRCTACSNSTTCTSCSGGYSPQGKSCIIQPASYITYNGLKIMNYDAGNDSNISSTYLSNIGISIATVGSTTCSATESHPCCWVGKTASSCNSTNSNYSGCYRTVCDWWAGKKICESFGWRMPTQSEMRSWRTTPGSNSALVASLTGTGATSLQICDSASTSNAPQCALVASCSYTNYGHCNSYHIWSSTPYGSNVYVFYLTSNSFIETNYVKNCAFAVRCVKTL